MFILISLENKHVLFDNFCFSFKSLLQREITDTAGCSAVQVQALPTKWKAQVNSNLVLKPSQAILVVIAQTMKKIVDLFKCSDRKSNSS